MRHQHSSLVAGFTFVLVSAVAPVAAVAQTDEAALTQFSAAIDKYVAMQRSIRLEVPAFQPNSEPEAISNASDTLARAIQRARPRARQGEFFTPEVRRALQQRMTVALAHVDFAALTGRDDPEERSSVRFLRTHLRLPVNRPLATMPSSVLDALPPLPEELEYRFVGNDLVLRDRLACLVIDHMRIAVPSR